MTSLIEFLEFDKKEQKALTDLARSTFTTFGVLKTFCIDSLHNALRKYGITLDRGYILNGQIILETYYGKKFKIFYLCNIEDKNIKRTAFKVLR